jgi:hypothetical protein
MPSEQTDDDIDALVRDIMQVPYSKSKARAAIVRVIEEARIDELEKLRAEASSRGATMIWGYLKKRLAQLKQLAAEGTNHE